jgi:hypothetical protein
MNNIVKVYIEYKSGQEKIKTMTTEEYTRFKEIAIRNNKIMDFGLIEDK